MNHVEVLTAFTAAHDEYFEPLSQRQIEGVYARVLQELLPPDWQVVRSEVWLGAQRRREQPGPAQGFKIHVSSIPPHAEAILRAVVPLLLEVDVDFKVAADPQFLVMMNGKRYNRGGSGKFMAIYPRTTEQFVELMERLYERTQPLGFLGPYILSDRRYRDSRILYYRYGGFTHQTRLLADGTSEHVIRDPEGNAVPDRRLAYFQLPSWVADPFGGSSGVPTGTAPVLKERYEVRKVLAYSNSGGVYIAHDRVGDRTVIVKEGRPYTAQWQVGNRFVDAPELLAREHAILERLHDLGTVPEPIDFFQEWEHTFQVQEQVVGFTLQRYWAASPNILTPYVLRPGRIAEFLPKFVDLGISLIDSMRAIHERGVVLGDVSPNNVVVDPLSMKVRFIDLESAVRPEVDQDYLRFSAQWATPGFRRAGGGRDRQIGYDDDLYGLGMLLYCSIAPVQGFLALNPEAHGRILERFVELGLPRAVMQAIQDLCDGRVEEGRARLLSLRN